MLAVRPTILRGAARAPEAPLNLSLSSPLQLSTLMASRSPSPLPGLVLPLPSVSELLPIPSWSSSRRVLVFIAACTNLGVVSLAAGANHILILIAARATLPIFGQIRAAAADGGS